MGFHSIGILSAGEMGYHWAKLLKSKGADVLTYLAGRSNVTRQRSENAGIKSVSSLTDLIIETDLVVSLVVPSAALPVAADIAQVLAKLRKKDFIFLDANAISPMTAHSIGENFSAFPEIFVDGCIIGSSAKLAQNTVVYVSGPRAERLDDLKYFGFSVRNLGADIGQASAFKIIYAGLTKGLQGLLVELLIGAKGLKILDQIIECYDERFPGLIQKVGRNIAALPIHAGRRSEEMEELHRTFQHYGFEPEMPMAAGRVLEKIATLNMEDSSEDGERKWSLAEALEALYAKGFLRKKTPFLNSPKTYRSPDSS